MEGPFAPRPFTFECVACGGKVEVQVPYQHLPVMPSGWVSVSIAVTEADYRPVGMSFVFPMYCHASEVSTAIRHYADEWKS